MIERYVMVKLADAWSNPDGRAAVATETRARLSEVPGVRAVTVGVPADEKSEVWDVSIAVRFDDLDAMATYIADPLHRKYVDEYLSPKLAVVKAWNFEVPAG